MQLPALQNIFTHLPWVYNQSKRLGSTFVPKEKIFGKTKCEPAIQTRSYYLPNPINLLTYQSQPMSFTPTIFSKSFSGHEKFDSISFAWFDRYNYKSLQINNISPYLGLPITGDNIHTSYIISTLLPKLEKQANTLHKSNNT